MSEWKSVTLADVADVIAGYAFKGEHFGGEGEKVIKIKDITPPSVDVHGAQRVDFTHYSKSKLEKYKLAKRDYVVAMTGATIGKIGKILSDDEAYINQRVAKIQAKESCDRDFIYYNLIGSNFEVFIQNNIDSHSAQENISASSIGRYPIQLPDLEEQKSIASVLSSLDDKIDLLHRQNKTLEAMAETLFRQWFVEEAGDWEVVRLGDIADVGWGDTNTTKSSYVEAGYLAYSATGPDGFMDHYDFDKSGIVVSAIGANCGKIWFANGKWSCIKNTIRIFSNDSLVSEEYLYFLLNKPEGWPIRGSAQPFISQTDARNIEIPYPSKEKSLAFNEFCRPAFSKIAKNIEQIKTIENLRDSLLPKLMSGEVRVSTL